MKLEVLKAVAREMVGEDMFEISEDEFTIYGYSHVKVEGRGYALTTDDMDIWLESGDALLNYILIEATHRVGYRPFRAYFLNFNQLHESDKQHLYRIRLHHHKDEKVSETYLNVLYLMGSPLAVSKSYLNRRFVKKLRKLNRISIIKKLVREVKNDMNSPFQMAA